jgi:hypothetical protein
LWRSTLSSFLSWQKTKRARRNSVRHSLRS